MSPRSSRSWPLAGLAALVVLNVVLIGLLVLRPAPAVDEEERTVGSPTPEATEAPPAKQEVEPLSPPDGSASAGRTERLVVNADATTAWRATVGQCGSPGTLERTVDGGQTWEPLPSDLGPVSRLRVLGPQSLVMIGGAEECTPTYLRSSDAGSSWTPAGEYLAGSWYLDPADPGTLAGPRGAAPAPCAAMDLAALDTSDAAVLCAGGTLTLTVDGGASWAEVPAPVTATAIGTTDAGYVLAGSHGACGDAVAGARTGPDGTAQGEPTCAVAGTGPLAVAGTAGALWLWAGDQVAVSTDGGQSW